MFEKVVWLLVRDRGLDMVVINLVIVLGFKMFGII